MTNNYPFAEIWINGKIICLKDVLLEKEVGKTDFEKHTFLFIRDWFSGVNEFRLQTSGSTGDPKVIAVTREQMKASASLTQEALQLEKNYNALVCLDTRYIAGKMMLVRCFETGMKIFAVDPCANPLCRVPVDKTIHFAALVPYQVRTILESKHPHLLDGLMTCIIGGAPIDEKLHRNLQQFSTRVFLTYGMTETLSHVALRKINGGDASENFKTKKGVSVKKDSRDCLIIKVPFLKDEVITNDVAEVFNENEFKWIGRYDNIINTGGIKVSPEKIEERIGQIFTRLGIDNSFFIHKISDEKLGERIVLVIEGPFKDATVITSLREAFIHTFSPFELPREIFESPQFTFTATSKINRADSSKHARPVFSIAR